MEERLWVGRDREEGGEALKQIDETNSKMMSYVRSQMCIL